MTAIETVKEFQKWRRGEGRYAGTENGGRPEPMPQTPEQYGLAIDEVVKLAEIGRLSVEEARTCHEKLPLDVWLKAKAALLAKINEFMNTKGEP